MFGLGKPKVRIGQGSTQLTREEFALIVHGDAEGAENVQRDLRDWLSDMELVPAGAPALL